MRTKARRLRRIVGIVLAAGVVCYAGLLTAVLWNSHDQVQGNPAVLLVLGCKVESYGPSVLLTDRLEKAAEYWQKHPQVQIVVSGGQGRDEPETEARAMADYLTDRGVDPGQIYLEEQSKNTLENLKFSKQLLEDNGLDPDQGVAVVSNGFHLTRVKLLWKRVFGTTDHLSLLAAPSSHLPARLKMYVREPLALVKSLVLDRAEGA